MNDQIAQYINRYQDKIQDVVSEMESSFQKTGFSGALIQNIGSIEYSLLKDDLSGEYSLQGVWLYDSGYKQGMFLFHPDGSFFAEYDVVKPHPKKTNWFVEAITVWGKNASIKSEPKLIPAVS